MDWFIQFIDCDTMQQQKCDGETTAARHGIRVARQGHEKNCASSVIFVVST